MAEDDAKPAISPKLTWVIVAVALATAAAPHFFFPPPLQLHAQGLHEGWLGISVWAPAILAGVAFFFGVEFSTRNEEAAERFEPATRVGVSTIFVIFYFILVTAIYPDGAADMSGMRPWDELKIAIPLYAALRALETLFWQGFVQQRALANVSRWPRALTVAAFGAAIYLPFALAVEIPVLTGLIALLFAESLIAALAFELGFRVRAVMLIRAVCGAAFIWFQQATLL